MLTPENHVNLLGSTLSPGPTLLDAGVQHVLYISNPFCRNPDAAEDGFIALAHAAKQLGMSLDRANSARTTQGNEAVLAQHLPQDVPSVLVVGGGDGTIHHVANAYRRLANPYGLVRPLQVVGLGTGNNLAHAVLTHRTLRRPDEVLSEGRLRHIYPLSVSVKRLDGEPLCTFDAMAHMGVGIAARVAWGLNQPKFRGSRWHHVPLVGDYLIERATALEYFLRSRAFSATHHGEHPGQNGRHVEILAATMPHMAKGFRPRVNPFEREARLIEVASKIGGLATIAGLTLRLPIGEMVNGNSVAFDVVAEPNQIHYIHGDGEERRFAGDLRVEIGFGPSQTIVTTGGSLTGERRHRKHREKVA